ncbi:MAG: hypothetical protein ACE5OV_00040 [Candidatus Bathyarchaeia archaeon]
MNGSSLPINVKKTLEKTVRLFLLLIVAVSVMVSLPTATGKSSSNSYNYKFTVNEDGFTWVDITFQSRESTGSSWVFVPKFSPWKYTVTPPGEITESKLDETQDYVGEDYYFYQVFEFFFVSESSFLMEIQFNMTEGALIIEPRGIFFSPQIGFPPDSVGEAKAEVLFPSNYRVKEEFIASSSRITTYTVVSSNRVLFDLQDNLERLQIEFETAATAPTWKQLSQGVFSFRTVERYENYAFQILTLFNAVYDDFTDLFNVTLEDIDVQFFIPEFETLLSVGGYVPFSGQKMGEINVNIFFVRAVNGTIQVIALHELVHHFLWKAGLSPSDLLWFHEGTAQYVSIDTATELGYEGAEMEKDRLEIGVSQLGNDFSFLQEWTPENQPVDVTRNYVASYYVVSRLAEEYGGLNYYKRFFELIRGLKIESNDELAFHLSLAANASVDLKLKLWGFDIRLLYTGSKISPDLIYEAEKAVDGLSPVFLPYNLVAKFLYQQALLRLERGDVDGAKQLFEAAISLANLAPLLTLLTLVAIFAIVAYILLKRTSKPSFELPPLPPTFEQALA